MKKGEAQKRLGRNKGRHSKINKKTLSGGNPGFSIKSKGKKTKQQTHKGGLGPSEVAQKKHNKKNKKGKKQNKKTQKYQKESFSVISQFLVGVQKFSFLTTWPKKRAPKKHYKNRGFSNPFFEKQLWVTKRPCLDNKKTNPEIAVSIFFTFFFSFNNKKHKN